MSEQTTQPRVIYDPVTDTPENYLREGPEAQPPLDFPPATASRRPLRKCRSEHAPAAPTSWFCFASAHRARFREMPQIGTESSPGHRINPENQDFPPLFPLMKPS